MIECKIFLIIFLTLTYLIWLMHHPQLDPLGLGSSQISFFPIHNLLLSPFFINLS